MLWSILLSVFMGRVALLTDVPSQFEEISRLNPFLVFVKSPQNNTNLCLKSLSDLHLQQNQTGFLTYFVLDS